MKTDYRNVGELLIEMSDPKAVLNLPRKLIPCHLSKYAAHFVTQVCSGTYSYILEVNSVLSYLILVLIIGSMLFYNRQTPMIAHGI